MRFIVDTQLTPRLASFLESKGHDCIHTTHFDNGHLLQDAEIVAIAIEQRRTIISKDADFSDYYHLKGAPPNILSLQFGNLSNKDLMAYFDEYLNVIVRAFDNGAEYLQFSRDGIITN